MPSSKKYAKLKSSSLLFISPTIKLNGPRNFIRKCYYLLAFCGILLVYYLASLKIAHNYSDQLLKPSHYWSRIQILKKLNTELPNSNDLKCVNTAQLEQDNLNTLKEFMKFINKQIFFNYFLCFSSLFFTAKIEKYPIFRVKLNETIDTNINKFDSVSY